MASATRSAASRSRFRSSELNRRGDGRAHHQHPGQLAAGEQRHADHRIAVGLPEYRFAPGGNAPGEAVLERHRRALLAAPGCATRGGPEQEPLALLGQVDRRCVGLEHGAEAGHQNRQDVAQRAMGERGVNERLHSADHVRHPFRLHPGGLLAQQRLALGLAPEAIGHVAQEAGREHLAADGHPRRAHLGREATSVAALELELQNAGGVGLRRVEQIAAKPIVGLTQLGRDDQSPQRLARLLRRPTSRACARPPRSRCERCRHGRWRQTRPARCPARSACGPPAGRAAARAPVTRASPSHPVEQSRHEHARDRRGADRKQPAHVGARQVPQGQHDRVGQRREDHVRDRGGALEEVERVEDRPAEEQRVESGLAGELVGQRDHHRAERPAPGATATSRPGRPPSSRARRRSAPRPRRSGPGPARRPTQPWGSTIVRPAISAPAQNR